MDRDLKSGKSLESRFGEQKHNYRNELIKLAVHFDGVIAVGDLVEKEYLYLVGDNKYQKKSDDGQRKSTRPAFPDSVEDELSSINVAEKIKVVYNGIPFNKITFTEKNVSRERLCLYGETLFNFKPDIIFTHVTRLVISKGLWRDIRFLEEMDGYFTDNGLKGFYILLSSLVATGRNPEEIYRMEKEYGWPLLHKEGYPDLIDYEKDIYASISLFNAKSRSIKGVFINQYGFNRNLTGIRIPEGTSFSDIRYGSDVELGFSIYEPFGIAQIENIPYGGIAFLSRSCGCSFLLEECYRETTQKPYYIINFAAPMDSEVSIKTDEDITSVTAYVRDKIESELFEEHGAKMFEKIPKNQADREKAFSSAKKNAAKLDWDHLRIGFLTQ